LCSLATKIWFRLYRFCFHNWFSRMDQRNIHHSHLFGVLLCSHLREGCGLPQEVHSSTQDQSAAQRTDVRQSRGCRSSTCLSPTCMCLNVKLNSCYPYYIKAKAVPLHATEALGGEKYSSYSFSTLALGEGEWTALRHGRALAPGR
jgi:hypothetical protein